MSEFKNNKESVYENVNAMPLNHGKNLHMDVGQGDLANRIITVGKVINSYIMNEF